MATSTLDPENIPEPDRQLGKGHGNKSLGPSDTSDTGSDMQGGTLAIDEAGLDLGLDRGTSEDADTRSIEASDGTEDSTGTGEVATAGRDSAVDLNADIGFDRIDHADPGEETDLDASPDDGLPLRQSKAQRSPQRPPQR